MSAPEILTFGCRLNAYESEVMRGHARTAGLDDVVIVNTCAVTAEAERQARQAIRKARSAPTVQRTDLAKIGQDMRGCPGGFRRVDRNDTNLAYQKMDLRDRTTHSKVHVGDQFMNLFGILNVVRDQIWIRNHFRSESWMGSASTPE